MPETKSEKLTKRWEGIAAKHLKGRTVVDVRYLTEEEAGLLQWQGRAVVLQFDDGSIYYPSADDEGNGPGALFGQTAGGEGVTLPVLS